MAMETYSTWLRLFELLRYYSWIVDRSHISIPRQGGMEYLLSAFVREQELLRRLVSQSILPTLALDISDSSVPRAVEQTPSRRDGVPVAEWMAETGGLCSD